MSADRTQTVYKIADAAEWRAAEAVGRYDGATVDLADGFIHFSTAAQLHATAAKHFAGVDGLVLVALDGARLAATHGEAFRYEPSRGGDLFPHLYAPLGMDAVRWVRPLPWEPDGHAFPREIEDEAGGA